MATTERKTAVGVFDDRRHAHYAVEELQRAGFTADQIGAVAPDGGPIEVPPLNPGTKAGEGAAKGVAAGMAIGGLVGAALAAGVIPGIGPVIAAGLLAGVLGGAAAGAAGGGIMGALIGLEIPEDEARHYEHQFHSGRTLVTVVAGDRYDEAEAILKRAAERPEAHLPEHGKGRSYGSTERGDSSGGGTAWTPMP
jgi:hypothetical protein